jgi:hypothetical protein
MRPLIWDFGIGRGSSLHFLHFANPKTIEAPARTLQRILIQKSKGIGGLIGRSDAFVKVPGITQLSDNLSCAELSDELVSLYFSAF